MLSSDLMGLFNSLTNKELKRFSAFMDSPFSDQGRYRSEVQILFKILQNYASSRKESLIQKEKVYKQVFPGREPQSGHLERVMFELNQLIRMFLLHENYFDPANSIKQQVDYIRVLRERNLIGKASVLLTQTVNEIEKASVKSSEDYYNSFLVYKQSYSFASDNNKWKDDLNITKTLHFLDMYFWSERLQMANHYLLIATISKLDQDRTSFMLDPTNLSPNITLEEEPSVYIAYKIYLLLIDDTPKKESFEELRQLLTEYEPKMDKETIAVYYSYLRNYCVHLYSFGHHDLVFELHQIQRDNLLKGYFHYRGKIPSTSYNSIAVTALKAKQSDWALSFIEQYKNELLDNSNASDLYNTNLADYYFYTRQYEKALDILPPNSTDLDSHLRARRLEIKIYYEIASDLLIYKLEAFKVYVHRASKKQISENARELHANFVNLLLQLTQTPPSDKAKAKRILARIEEKQQVAEKEWLLEKANQLIKGK